MLVQGYYKCKRCGFKWAMSTVAAEGMDNFYVDNQKVVVPDTGKEIPMYLIHKCDPQDSTVVGIGELVEIRKE